MKNFRDSLWVYALETLLAFGLMLTGVLCWGLSFLPPMEGNYWGLIALSTPLVLTANGLLLLLVLWHRRWILVLFPITALMFNTDYIFSMLQFGGVGGGQFDLKVGTLNVANFDWKNQMEETIDEVGDIVTREKLDVFCMQEFTNNGGQMELDSVAGRLREYLPNIVYETGQAIMSRYPIIDHEYVRFPSSGNDYLRADIDYEGDTIRVFSVHFQTTGVSSLKARYETDSAQKVPLDVLLRELEHNNRLRATQVNEIRGKIDSTKYPVLVLGDFNDTPSSYTYRYVKGGMKDAFREAGEGFGSTFRGFQGVLRIDYIFCSPIFDVKKFRRLHDNVSDHLMITADLYLKGAKHLKPKPRVKPRRRKAASAPEPEPIRKDTSAAIVHPDSETVVAKPLVLPAADLKPIDLGASASGDDERNARRNKRGSDDK